MIRDDVPVVEQIITESVQLGEVDAQVRHFEEVLHFLRVGIVDGQVGRQDAEDDLALGGRSHAGVARLADHLGEIAGRLAGDAGERLGAVVREVAVHLPRAAEVVRALDEQGGRPERLERHDQVGEVELRFQVQLDAHVLHAVLRLPPRTPA